jgi:thiosulfate/3-mercaptopyruvate sulfurtransferase
MPFPAVLSPREVPAGSLLLDARSGAEAFAAGHLPGAVHADLDRCLSAAGAPGADPARGGRHPLPDPAAWAAQLGAWGITPDTAVVAYDDANGGGGAARLWWMLRAIGHERAAILDGGLQAGLAAGLAPGATPPPAPPHPGRRWLWPTVAMAEVDQLRQDPAWKVLDVRSRPRYRGETEPIDPVAGHIPGALNLPFAENLDAQGRYKSPEELRAIYQAFLASTPPDHLVVHCGSGVTACHTLAALDRAGLHGAALYVGSWSEWCRNPMPRATS